MTTSASEFPSPSPVVPRVPLLKRRYGNLAWDGVLRATGIAALVSIPLLLMFPQAGPLFGFMLVTMWVNGPMAPFLPAMYEPVLMLFGRLYPPLLIGLLGIAGTLYVEYLNYHLYQRILKLDALQGVHRSKTVKRISSLFLRAPFFTVWLGSWSLLPYWSVRFMSPITGYPVSRHLLATFLGRFPRLWFFAAVGAFWDVDIKVLFGITLGSILLAAVIWWYKGQSIRDVARGAPIPSRVPVRDEPTAMTTDTGDANEDGSTSPQPVAATIKNSRNSL